MNDINLGNMQIPVIKPQKGVDYYTETEKQELIQETTAKVNQIIEPKETERQANEQIRKLNEEDRKAKESTRISNETERQSNEGTRQNNENERQSNEIERQTNEQSRIEAEQSRNTFFNNQMTENEKAIQNIKDKTTEYNANAETKTNEFNSNAGQKTQTFNENVEQKTQTFNENANAKLQEINQIKDITEAKIAEINEKDEAQDTEISNIKSKNTEQDRTIQDNAESIEELKAENERLREDINAISVTEQAEGENITLNDTSEARFKKFGIGGNSWQETSTIGKNKLDINKPYLTGKVYDVNGNEYNESRANTYSLKVKEGITYFISIAIGGSFFTTWKKGVMASRVIKESGVVTITKDDSFDEIRYSLFTDVENFAKSYINENENTGYEAFVPNMPSTEYKSDIQNVTGNANVTICNKNLSLLDFRNLYNVDTVFTNVKQTENELSFSQAAGTGAYKSVLYKNILTNRQLIGKKITISCDIVGGTNTEIRIAKKGNGGATSIIGNVKKDNPLTFVLTEDALPLGAFFYASQSVDPSTTINCKFSNFMIEEGETVTDYVEHQSQTFTFPLAEGQRLMLGDYLADDGIHHKRGQYIFTGNESFVLGTDNLTDVYRYYCTNFTIKKADYGEGYCTHFSKLPSFINKQGVAFGCDNNQLYLFLSKTDFPNIEAVKTYLAEQYANGTPVVIEYDLAEEEIEPYTEEQQALRDEIKKTAHSYGDTTHIFCTDETSLIFNVEAKADIQAMFNNLQAQILAGEV